MKKAMSVAVIIFTPVIVSLLLRLVIGILYFLNELLGLDIIRSTPDIFDFSRNWWFWLIAAILSLIAIFYLLFFIEDIDE